MPLGKWSTSLRATGRITKQWMMMLPLVAGSGLQHNWFSNGSRATEKSAGNQDKDGNMRYAKGSVCDDKGRSKEKSSPAAGKIVTPGIDQRNYAPEGMGMDPADHGTWLKPGVTGRNNNHDLPT